MVGVKGFEPPAPCSQSTYATKLRYTPLDPVAVTAVGFAPDDEIYLTIPASICQHLFSIFPKKLLHLPLTVPPLFFPQDLFKGSPLRGAVRRRAGLKGCPMGRGQGGGLASPSPICAPKPSFRRFRCSAWLIQLRQRTALSPLKRSCFRFAARTLRCRTEPALQAAPVFRSAYSASRNARPSGSLRSPSVCAPNQLFELLRCSGRLIELKLKRSTFRFAPLTLRTALGMRPHSTPAQSKTG